MCSWQYFWQISRRNSALHQLETLLAELSPRLAGWRLFHNLTNNCPRESLHYYQVDTDFQLGLFRIPAPTPLKKNCSSSHSISDCPSLNVSIISCIFKRLILINFESIDLTVIDCATQSSDLMLFSSCNFLSRVPCVCNLLSNFFYKAIYSYLFPFPLLWIVIFLLYLSKVIKQLYLTTAQTLFYANFYCDHSHRMLHLFKVLHLMFIVMPYENHWNHDQIYAVFYTYWYTCTVLHCGLACT